MKTPAEQLARDVLALPEEERKGIFLWLAGSLPTGVSHLAESIRRAEEMRSGKVAPMSEATFLDKLGHLRGNLRHARIPGARFPNPGLSSKTAGA